MFPTERNVLILAYLRDERESEARREHMLKLCPQPDRGFDRLVRFVKYRIRKMIESRAERPQDRIRVDGMSNSGDFLTRGANHG